MEDRDFYEVLQVQPSAEPEVITGAYNKLARKYHPDVNKSPDATRRMQLINAAYEVLGDAAKRAEYDRQRASRFTRTAPSSSTQSDAAETEEAITTIIQAVADVLKVAAPAFISWMQQRRQKAEQVASSPMPSIVYPNPSVTYMFWTSTRVEGTIHHAYTNGVAYIDYGYSTAYEFNNGPHILADNKTSYTLKVTLNDLWFNTTYHWRLRYVTEDGQTYIGDDQVFTTDKIPSWDTS